MWAVETVGSAPRLTIRQWHEQYRTDRDHRTTDRWPMILAAANDQGRLTRAAIVAIYEESGSTEVAADKAIGRWVNKGKLLRETPEATNCQPSGCPNCHWTPHEPPRICPSTPIGFMGGPGGCQL